MKSIKTTLKVFVSYSRQYNREGRREQERRDVNHKRERERGGNPEVRWHSIGTGVVTLLGLRLTAKRGTKSQEVCSGDSVSIQQKIEKVNLNVKVINNDYIKWK